MYDLSAGRVLYTLRPDVPRPPASLEKLYTSIAALELLGPDARLDTTVLGQGWLGAHGVWHGSLYLHGDGDPTFGTAGFDRAAYGEGSTVSALVEQLRDDGIRHVTGRVMADDAAFDTERGDPSTGGAPDVAELGGELGALTFDHGQVGREGGPHAPARYAALALAGALRGGGVSVQRSAGVGSTPVATQLLAQAYSPPLSSLLALMNPPSDDFFAEMLTKRLGASVGGSGSTAAGAALVAQVLSRYGVHARIVDGSGLCTPTPPRRASW